MNYEILFASNNKHKLQEVREILSPYGITVYGLSDIILDVIEPIENGETYFDNALIKANHYKSFTSLPIIADDSGLEVVALNNIPGLNSARFAKECGHSNRKKVSHQSRARKKRYADKIGEERSVLPAE